RPTSVTFSRPLAMSTSTWTACASSPITAQLCTWASMVHPFRGQKNGNNNTPVIHRPQRKRVWQMMEFLLRVWGLARIRRQVTEGARPVAFRGFKRAERSGRPPGNELSVSHHFAAGEPEDSRLTEH